MPNRIHIVLTRDKNYKINNENVQVVTDISEIDKFINDKNENFVIGGESIYKTLIDKCQKLYITQINQDFDGDAYFPEINDNKFKIIEQIKGPKDENNFDYYYITYQRI